MPEPISSPPRPSMAEPQARHLKSSPEQGVLVLTLTTARIEGEAVADALLQEMLAALPATETPNFVVDFQLTHYLSIVAFRALLGFRRRVLESGGKLVLCGLNPVIGDVFFTTRMISTDPQTTAPFVMEADVPAAVARLVQP